MRYLLNTLEHRPFLVFKIESLIRYFITAMEQNKFLVLAKESSLLDSIVTSSQESLIDHDESTIKNEVLENFKPTNGRKVLLRDFFAVLALSFHAIFEGLAIGLESESTKIWILFAGKIDFVKSIRYEISDKLCAIVSCTI